MRISFSLVFAIYVVAEAALLIWFGSTFGVGPLIGLLVAGFLLGLLVMRIAGISAIYALSSPQRRAQSFGVTTADGREEVVLGPQPTAADLQQSMQRTARDVGMSSLLFGAGVLLAVPGIISDVAGLLLLLPPVRRRIAGRMSRSFGLPQAQATRITVVTTDESGWTAGKGTSSPEPAPDQGPRVIQGEILPPPPDQDH